MCWAEFFGREKNAKQARVSLLLQGVSGSNQTNGLFTVFSPIQNMQCSIIQSYNYMT